MTKLQEIRDELRPRDLHFRKECEGFRCGAKASWNEGFDAACAEWEKIVEPLIEALEWYSTEYKLALAREALEKYRKARE